jgi:hypothetical protein
LVNDLIVLVEEIEVIVKVFDQSFWCRFTWSKNFVKESLENFDRVNVVLVTGRS